MLRTLISLPVLLLCSKNSFAIFYTYIQYIHTRLGQKKSYQQQVNKSVINLLGIYVTKTLMMSMSPVNNAGPNSSSSLKTLSESERVELGLNLIRKLDMDRPDDSELRILIFTATYFVVVFIVSSLN